MTYSVITADEFKKLLDYKKNYIIISFVLIALIWVSTFVLATNFISEKFNLNALDIALVVSGLFTVFIMIKNRDFLLDVLMREKKIYKGVVSRKRQSKRKGKKAFYLFVDGNGIKVSESDFNMYLEGDKVEYHYFAHTRLISFVKKY